MHIDRPRKQDCFRHTSRKIQQVIWAFENVRKEEQKKFSKTHRRYFKNSKKLLLKRFNKLENEQQQQVLVMLEASVNLSRSHWYKEKFLEILDCNDRETAKEKMQEWIYNASNCGIPQFEKCAVTMQNWLTFLPTSSNLNRHICCTIFLRWTGLLRTAGSLHFFRFSLQILLRLAFSWLLVLLYSWEVTSFRYLVLW